MNQQQHALACLPMATNNQQQQYRSMAMQNSMISPPTINRPMQQNQTHQVVYSKAPTYATEMAISCHQPAPPINSYQTYDSYQPATFSQQSMISSQQPAMMQVLNASNLSNSSYLNSPSFRQPTSASLQSASCQQHHPMQHYIGPGNLSSPNVTRFNPNQPSYLMQNIEQTSNMRLASEQHSCSHNYDLYQQNQTITSTTTDQTCKLVESSSSNSSSSNSSSTSSSWCRSNKATAIQRKTLKAVTSGGNDHDVSSPHSKSDTKVLQPTSAHRADDDGCLKNYLTQLVLASNVPFAYTIILVAFLITMIAATSIITILTIVLTLTGYTAYPITENTFNTSLAIGVVCASFALALVTASLIVWRRHCQAAYYYLDEPQDASRGTSSPQLSETYDDSEYGSIPVNDWMKHVQKLHQDSDIGFAREFEQIQQANQKQSLALTCDHSQLAENKHKNRYINIVAYDHTRVILRPPLGGQKKPGFDYINANFIDGYNKPRAYIGTQGPLVSTFDDYWRMIWEQRVVIIVMITNLQERGRRKCDMYWPKEGLETYGYVQVKLLQEVVMATYTLRTFTVRNLKMKKRTSGSERTVYQYHYTNWPDHGVPDHPLPVLSFVRKSAAANPPGAGAIICHCSAGCGRSGTYIVIDAMLKQIRAKQSINVVDFLKHIRAQRNYLVQTEEQYIFIHDALVEAIESGETEIPSNFIAKYIQLLQTGGSGGGSSCNNTTGSTTKLLNSGGSNYSLLNGLCQSPINANATMSTGNNLCVVSANNAIVNDQQQLISSSNTNLLLANGAGGKSSQATTVSRSQSNQWSLLERQYRLVASFKAKDFCVVSALKPCNKNKNRTLNLIPLEAHRVHITPKPATDGSDYINATFLMGFNHLHEFIATQHPVQETFSDFWQMVYDHNSQTIVLLTQMDESNSLLTDANQREYPQFWPQKEDEVDYGSFKVKLIQESTLMKADNGGLIITRDFIMRSNQDDYELQTRIIHCPGWPECCGPLSAVFDLIQVVQQATQQQASQQRMHDGHQNSGTVTIGQEHEPQNGGPIIVVDKFGGTEAATFAVLTTLFKQINFEDAVDVYMYAKLAHLRRPGIWSSQDDYLFLYRAMENYASSLLAAQQQQRQQQQLQDKSNITAANLTAPISLANLHHHQTMTLDRHGRHNKSSPSISASALKSSTMKRRPNNKAMDAALANTLINQQQTQLATNNNSLTSPAAHLNHGLVANEFLAMKNNQNKQQLVDHNHNSMQYSPAPIMQQQMAKGSPYNSATSVGASSHQHLLAASNGPVTSLHQQQQQVGRHTNQIANDHHYLYSVQ